MSKKFFQEGIDKAIELLLESLVVADRKIKLQKQQAAFEIIERLIGLLTGLKGKEEQEFAKLMRYNTELLNDLRAYEAVSDKRNIIEKMNGLAGYIVNQSKKVENLAKIDELVSLSFKHNLGHILSSAMLLEKETGSKVKIKEVILKHALQDWNEKEAKNFAKLINYIDNYLQRLHDAKVTRSPEAAIENLKRAKIFGVLIVRQLKKVVALL